jgi:hypothetical protein
MPRLFGRLAPAERLTLTVRPGTRTMTFRHTVPAVEDGRSFAGSDHRG